MTWMISRNAHEMNVQIKGEEWARVKPTLWKKCGLLGDEDLNRQTDVSPEVGDMSRENQ